LAFRAFVVGVAGLAKGNVWKGTHNDLRDTRAATVEAAKVPWKDNGLRHSFVSHRLADIQNAAETALEAGSSPAMVFMDCLLCRVRK
jgi:hypothetical protein